MRLPATLVVMLVSAACASTAQAQSTAEPSGTITVGDQTWLFVPSISCLVHPNGVANLAGHAAGDPSLEIVIDYGGPDQITIGGDGRDAIWHAMRDTLEVQIEGQRIRGTATFNEYFTGTGESAQGSFDITC